MKIFRRSKWNIHENIPQIEDAARPECSDMDDAVRVLQDTRLDYRVLDLRTAANQAIFRIEAGVCKLFRNFLSSKLYSP